MTDRAQSGRWSGRWSRLAVVGLVALLAASVATPAAAQPPASEDEPPAPSGPLPEEWLSGTAIALGVPAATAGLITLMLGERSYDRADGAPIEHRAGLEDEAERYMGASIVALATAGALVVGGLIGLYLIGAERERAAAREREEVTLDVRLFPGGLSLRARF